MTTPLQCPECGSAKGIYARADIRWNGDRWTIGDVEDELDCIECDHTWSASEADVDLPQLAELAA